MRDNIFRRNSKAVYGVILAVACLLALLLALPGTRKLTIGIFGWSAVAFDVALAVFSIIMLAGKKPTVNGIRVVLYFALFQMMVCTLHVFLTRDFFPGRSLSNESYLVAPIKLATESPFTGTVGGVWAAVIIIPVKLLVGDFGLTAAIEFAITAVLGLFALIPLFGKINSNRFKSEKKSKLSKLFIKSETKVDPVQTEAPAVPMPANNKVEGVSKAYNGAPKYPTDNRPLFTDIAGAEAIQEERKKRSMQILYGPNPNMPTSQNQQRKPSLVAFGENIVTPFREGGGYYAPSQTAQNVDVAKQKPIGNMTREEQKEYILTPQKFNENYISPIAKSIPAPTPQFNTESQVDYSEKYHEQAKIIERQQAEPKPEEVNIDFTQTIQESPLFGGIKTEYSAPQSQAVNGGEFFNGIKIANEEFIPVQSNVTSSVNVKNEPTQEQPNAVNVPFAMQEPAKNTKVDVVSDEEKAQSVAVQSKVSQITALTEEEPREQYQMRLDDVQYDAPNSTPVNEASNSISEFDRSMMHYDYHMPPINMFADYPPYSNQAENYEEVKALIEDAMHEYHVEGKVLTATRGPTFTLYEVQLATGVDTTKVRQQRNNLQMRLAIKHLRIVSPLPGKNAIGLEISNVKRDTVGFKDLLLSPEFNQDKPGIVVGFGRDINGKIYCDNIAKMPHLLVAGTTGSGKSVFIHNIVMSIIFKYSPEDVRLMMIDPKTVEFSAYEGMPHMLVPEAAKEPAEAINMLNWLAAEVHRRYEFMKIHGCNEMSVYNNTIRDKEKDPKMFSIVMIVDEVAELMLESKNEVDDAIASIAQLGRACGVHLVLATQRPTVNVISGIIKSNITCRVGLKVATVTESNIILNQAGAEALLGNGDMLYAKHGAQAERMQSAYVDLTSEIIPIVRYLKENNKCIFNESVQRAIFSKVDFAKAQEQRRQEAKIEEKNAVKSAEDEETIRRMLRIFFLSNKASISLAQAKLGIGYLKAKRLMDDLFARGYVSEEETGNKTRRVLMPPELYEEIYGESLGISSSDNTEYNQ